MNNIDILIQKQKAINRHKKIKMAIDLAINLSIVCTIIRMIQVRRK